MAGVTSTLIGMPTDSDSAPVLWPGIVFGIPALVLLIIGFALIGNTATFLAQSTVTTGTVVDNESRLNCSRSNDRNQDCTPNLHPVVVFTSATGEEIRFTSDVGSGTALYAVGDQVQVRYPTHRPSDAEIDGFQIWLAPVIVTGLGVVFGLIATGTLVGYVRKVRAGAR